MNRELDKTLCQKYPNLYRHRHSPMTHTCMCWGFEVCDGWYDLLDRCSAKLEACIVKLQQEGKEGDYPICASQVKEKYGTLRFYLTAGTDEMYDIIGEATHESAHTCEICGKPGKERGEGWIETRCNSCWKKEENNYVD